MKLALALLFALPLCLGAEEVILSDFNNKTVPFVYGSWLDESTGETRLEKSPEGLKTTEGATAQGGACERVPVNVASQDVIKLTFSVLDGNTATGLAVLLEDAAGTQGGWHFSTEGMIPGEPKEFTSGEIGSPDFTNPEGSPLDLANIVSWHIQGDYSNEGPIRVRFEKLAILRLD